MTKSKWLGALLNLALPGLGTFYGRNIKKAIVIYCCLWIVAFSVRFISYSFGLFVFWVVLITVFFIFTIVSGYRDIERAKIYPPAKFDKSYAYVLIISLHVVLIGLIRTQNLPLIGNINFFVVSSPSMEPGLYLGDRVAVEKSKSIQRGDITVLWFPDDTTTAYVERCIGMPGDSLGIDSNRVIVNNTAVAEQPLKFSYLVKTDGTPFSPSILENFHVGSYLQINSSTYQFMLADDDVKQLKTMKIVKNVEHVITAKGTPGPVYPGVNYLDWNSHFYGPVYIPKKGDKIQLTEFNKDLYIKCIQFENTRVSRDKKRLWVNGQAITEYTFQDNYYFMMGDNRDNSFDSRFWGFVPEKLIIGKGLYIYWGNTRDRIGKELTIH